MSIAKLHKKKSSRVMGIDASTRSLAFCVFDDRRPVQYGEIFFEGADVYERILDAKKKTRAIKKRFSVDFIALEAAVMVRSAATGLKMAYIFGAIMGELIEHKNQVVEVHPITWQSYIGNKNFTKAEKDKVKLDYPGKSENWYKSKIREIRKSKTIEFCSSIGVNVESDNVADATGIAWYALNNLTR